MVKSGTESMETPKTAALRLQLVDQLLADLTTLSNGRVSPSAAAKLFANFVFSESFRQTQEAQPDPVIPSDGDPDFVAQRLSREDLGTYCTKCFGYEEALEIGAAWIQQCNSAAGQLNAHRVEAAAELWSDQTLGVSIVMGDGIVTLQAKGVEVKAVMATCRFNMMRRDYLAAGHEEHRLLTRIMVVWMRYETLMRYSGAHSSLPLQVFTALHKQLGVSCECFASPLNHAGLGR